MRKSLDSFLRMAKIAAAAAAAEDGDEEDSKAGRRKHPAFSMECHWVCPPHSRAGPTPRTSLVHTKQTPHFPVVVCFDLTRLLFFFFIGFDFLFHFRLVFVLKERERERKLEVRWVGR